MSTVLFGTIEYYERELISYFTNNHISNKDDATMKIFIMLEAEIFNVFLFDEAIRIKCMQNLLKAFCRVSETYLVKK
ncbi:MULTISPECIES: hypothetical protein [Bacillaceae]|uniref:TetR family transcriptional regulator n=2 Tax=Cytobacillus TaxID=2675230 RepID=A0ABX3CLQ5_9BACI|nr:MULTISPECIES: hypothetical protein [Bacillaceae]MBU8772261.1 hypothetical protein [Cytobacillus oceanisediminis]MCM3402220.1 hypothetical protein [Cytobacillus oceanisediminis]MDK7668237.1 hypothetical protein [Cytobacillus oceanisediminis]OHX42660.1 hypothetical protein BBV17_27470 [Cytobacillus oceanisediminis]QOK26007.1 hypothetical protein IIE26_20355 [Cytobacillus oceanisediminis]